MIFIATYRRCTRAFNFFARTNRATRSMWRVFRIMPGMLLIGNPTRSPQCEKTMAITEIQPVNVHHDVPEGAR